jgi:hypothetical protein
VTSVEFVITTGELDKLHIFTHGMRLMLLSYANAPIKVRDNIVAAHDRAWNRIARAGAWFDGKTRIAIAAETRHASKCALCSRRKKTVSPLNIDGKHDGLGALAERLVEPIHRIVTDSGRLARGWFDSVVASGVRDTEFVEIVGVVATVVTIDTFCRAIGAPLHALPTPVSGKPHYRRPRTAHQRGEAWVPMIHPKDLVGELDTAEEQSLAAYWGGVPSNIRRALSLVPEEAYEWFRLVEVQYLPGKAMRDFSNEYRAITHAQIELIAGRVSVLNQCFY